MRRKEKPRYDRFTQKVSRKVANGFDVPENAFRFLPQIEITSNTEAIIESNVSVLEYDSNIVKLDLGLFLVSFKGARLELCSMEGRFSVVKGIFTSIEFSN